MLFEIKDLWVRYGQAEALKGISLHINAGEIVCLIGANGAGKTTTLKAASGLKAPVEGSIRFGGQSVERMPAYKIVKLGMAHCPEGRMVFAPMTVKENLNLGAYKRKDHAAIRNDLEMIYSIFPILKERTSQKAGSLSGGEQQMLAIARALMSRPKLLLLDEPSLGLSPIYQDEIKKIIKNINRESVSIMLVEQNANMALSISNRAYVIELGSVVAQGKASDLLDDPTIRQAYLGC